MKKYIMIITFCLPIYSLYGQESGIFKIFYSDTIMWQLEKNVLEISLVSPKIGKKTIGLYDNLLPTQIVNIEYEKNIVAILINSFGKNFEYYLFENKDTKWQIKSFYEWRDISRFVGLSKPELFDDVIDDAKLITLYEVNIVYKNKPINRRYIFSLDGKKQIIETKSK